ncbi:hypothetical protein BJY00DRAFT_305776 [Aspergillus carlsbadensis]|nr:hypothetical protein BJY00DRAFT_305776 [Aspergillus carlsbadensis]
MATRRRVRPHHALDDLLNDDDDAGTRLDKSLVSNPRPSFYQQATRTVYKPAEPQWGDGALQQHQQEIQLDKITAQTILNPATVKDVTVHFDMNATADVGVLLEQFSRLKRLGHFQAASQYFDDNLRDFTEVLPVIIEYADMLVEQGAYQRLKEFLQQHRHILQRARPAGPNLTDQERYPMLYQANLELLDALSAMHLTTSPDKPEETVQELAHSMHSVFRNRSGPVASLDSAEVQIFRYALKVLSRIETETDPGPEFDFDYWANCDHLYSPLVATGQVWDARDLLCALIELEGAINTWEVIFQTSLESPAAFTRLFGDWNMRQYDEATYLAVLDILVHASNELSTWAFAAPTPKHLSLAARCLSHARDVATCLKENNPELVHCRSYLSWILAETQLRRKRNPPSWDLGPHLSGYPGLTVWPDTLPIYLPIRSENPTSYPPSADRDQTPTSDDELLEAAVETAMSREDYTTEAACLAELIYRGSGGPHAQDQRFSRMYHLQFRRQGDILSAQHTCLTRWLTRTTDPGRRALLADITELQRYVPTEFPYRLTLTCWGMNVLKKSLVSQTDRPAAQPQPQPPSAWLSASDLPQYIKNQLQSRHLARSYGLDLDTVGAYRRRRARYLNRSPDRDRASRWGLTRPPAPPVRRTSYERERPRRDGGSRGEVVYESPGGIQTQGKLEAAGEAKVSARQEDSDDAEDPEDPEDSEGKIKPPTRQSTVEVADESEVE